MKHKITVSYAPHKIGELLFTAKMKRYISTALDLQGVTFPCEINVLITDDETIRALNSANRNIDKATDVLSFPMFDFEEGARPSAEELVEYIDPDTGLVPLGDMAISYDHIIEQAKEFGHSRSRELGYLTVHSVLHLLGYDHMDEAEMKAHMRAREEVILTQLKLKR